jgi:hypothetical protein
MAMVASSGLTVPAYCFSILLWSFVWPAPHIQAPDCIPWSLLLLFTRTCCVALMFQPFSNASFKHDTLKIASIAIKSFRRWLNRYKIF